MSKKVLFPDQQAVMNDTRSAMRKYKRILIRAETGFGKTVLSMVMINAAVEKGSTCWFVMPRKQLLAQTAQTFIKDGVGFGFIASGRKPNPFASVQLCTSGTLSRRLDRMRAPTVIFIDETDFGGAEVDKIVQWGTEKGCWIIGLTATPWRSDGKGLGCWFDHMVDGPSLAELIEMKRLSEYKLYAPQKPDMSGVSTGSNGDWNTAQTEERITRKLTGNAIEHYKKHAFGKLAVSYSVSVKKSIEACEMFNEAGVPAGVVHSKMSDEEIDSVIMRFARRELLVLENCEMIVFGFDLSSRANCDVTIEAMIDKQPTKSLRKQRQKNGRVLRMKDFPALMFDHAGNSEVHGLPDADQEWTLSDREKQKRSSSEKTEPTRQCPDCYMCHRPSPECPGCGHVYPVMSREIEEVDGDLVEVTDRPAIMTPKQEIGKIARTEGLTGLIQYGKDKGYKPAWARKQAQIRGVK